MGQHHSKIGIKQVIVVVRPQCNILCIDAKPAIDQNHLVCGIEWIAQIPAGGVDRNQDGLAHLEVIKNKRAADRRIISCQNLRRGIEHIPVGVHRHNDIRIKGVSCNIIATSIQGLASDKIPPIHRGIIHRGTTGGPRGARDRHQNTGHVVVVVGQIHRINAVVIPVKPAGFRL